MSTREDIIKIKKDINILFDLFHELQGELFFESQTLNGPEYSTKYSKSIKEVLQVLLDHLNLEVQESKLLIKEKQNAS